MPNQPYDEDKQRSRGQPTNGPRYQQGTPYRNRMNGQNPYRPYNRQNPANFSNSLRGNLIVTDISASLGG